MSRKSSAVRQDVETVNPGSEGKDVQVEIKTETSGEIAGAVIDGTEVVIDKTANVEEPAKELSYDELLLIGETALIEKFGNKSNAIRALAAMNGGKCGPISKALNIRFQHARNVLSKPLKRVIAAERAAAKSGDAE